jgi:ABC-type Zn uptake system ZnuABC Zn-binding protein ZnuA
MIRNNTTLKSLALVFFLALLRGAPAAQAQQIQVCCTVTDLGSLVRDIGGNQVSVTVFAKGTEDAHFVNAKPSFVKSLSQAELYVQVGLELEIGYSPVLLQGARNAKVNAGAAGNLEVATAIQPMNIPAGVVNRAMGDVHPGGNPHFLSDPMSGLKVARLIRDKLIELRPPQKTYFEERYDAFAKRLCSFLVGEELAKKYSVEEVEKLALLFQYGKLETFLKSQDQDKLLGGWLGMMLPFHGASAVDDHDMWPYFARTFGIKIVAHLEPKPGIPPTTQHLGTVVDLVKREKVRVLLANAFYDAQHAQLVSQRTGAKVVSMAHQVGARPGTDDYLSTVDYNVKQLATVLKEGK